MTRHDWCPVCGGLNCGTACKNQGATMSDDSLDRVERSMFGPTTDTERRLLRERDEARKERDAAMRVITDFLAAMGVESGVPPSLEVVADAAKRLVDTYEVLAGLEEGKVS